MMSLSNESESDPLLEWNRLNKKNTEQKFVSAVFQSFVETSPLVDKFSVWLIAGAGMTGALMITQIKSVLPFLTAGGFKAAILLLVASAISGLIAKYFALKCEVQWKMFSKIVELSNPIFEKFQHQEDEIINHANVRGIELETNFNMTNVITELSRPFPFWMKWLLARKASKSMNDRQFSNIISVKAYMSQTTMTLIQALFFLAFMVSAAFYSNAI